jgi:hypothetical protein
MMKTMMVLFRTAQILLETKRIIVVETLYEIETLILFILIITLFIGR